MVKKIVLLILTDLCGLSPPESKKIVFGMPSLRLYVRIDRYAPR
jgi:hypothetical protein